MKKFIKCIVSLIVGASTALLLIFITSSVYENVCKNRTYEDFNLDNNPIYTADVCIAKKQVEGDQFISHYEYFPRGSGVIVGKQGNKYYALTANHVMDMDENDEYILKLYGSPTLSEYRETEHYSGCEDYYSRFYIPISLEIVDESKDLALVSFESNRDLTVLKVASKDAVKGDKIAVIGNPEGSLMTTYGKILSDKKLKFKDKLTTQYVQKINAYETHGHSGCMVVNQDAELVGLIIGGGENVFGKFQYGAMVSATDLREFLEKANIDL